MADQLFLSYRLRSHNRSNMLVHYERMLRKFPYSRLTNSTANLRINAISYDEPPVVELPMESPVDVDAVLGVAKEFWGPDGAVQLETHWDLWQFVEDWTVQPAKVVLSGFGPDFDDEREDHLRIDFGVDTLFLPQLDLPEAVFMAQSNIRSLLHLVSELDAALNPLSRRLWTDSGENFAERLQSTLQSASS